jgi:hypothetical protein
MYDFEDLQETPQNASLGYDWSVPRPPGGGHRAAYDVPVTGVIGDRTRSNKHYRDVHVECDVYSLKDPKYRSLWLSRGMIQAAHAGKNGTYVDMWTYDPYVPNISTNEARHRAHMTSSQLGDTMMLLDPEHALNAANVEKLSHGGIRDIPSVPVYSKSVDNVVPEVGPDATDLDTWRGLRYQFNYSKSDQLKHMARENFMKAIAGLSTERDTTARPASGVVT